METQSHTAKKGGTVAVIDDDDAVRNSLKFSLEIDGFDVLIFADGRQLLDQAEFPVCDCLVVDQNLPQMTGLELIAELRRRNRTIPAVLITTHPSEVVRRQAALAGVPIVEKPLLNSHLFDALRRVMARSSPLVH